METMRRYFAPLLALALLALAAAAQDDGFVPIFNGENLDGWFGAQYQVEDGMLVCPAEGGGAIYTTKQYANFVFRFKFRFGPGANNGVAIRSPGTGDAAYEGMEIQILDDSAPEYAGLQDYQFHGSIYDLVPAQRGALKPPGEWNEEEITVDWRQVKVVLNGVTIVDADLDEITDEAKLARHPGLQRAIGHLGFAGHGHRIEFRDLAVKELEAPLNTPPPGFEALFNGVDLTGWKGLVANPKERAAMAAEALAEAQALADGRMRAHWAVEDGVLVFDGRGDSLCTARDYADFELYVDWKILPDGDSGIYLRGSPQVQIWDLATHPEGSGGLYNNQQHPSRPTMAADRPVGEWNTFFIRMVGEQVTIYLNGYKVVDEVVMENYWERDQPIYPTGQIELQNHGNTLWFRNVYLRELPVAE